MSSVEYIGSEVFSRSGLTSVVIQEGCSRIDRAAFKSCTHLTSVVIPDSVKEIAGWAFDGCPSLAEVEIPPNTKVDPYAFRQSTKKRRKE